MSCQWKKENGERKRQFLNFQKLLYGLPYDFGEEKAEGRFSVITDKAEREQYLQILTDIEEKDETYKGLRERVETATEAQLASAYSLLNLNGSQPMLLVGDPWMSFTMPELLSSR